MKQNMENISVSENLKISLHECVATFSQKLLHGNDLTIAPHCCHSENREHPTALKELVT